MALNMIMKGQTEVLMRGGAYELALAQLRDKKIIPDVGEYVHKKYPKALNISPGDRNFHRQTSDHQGRMLTWTETHEVVAPMIVESEAEEDAVRAALERAEGLGIFAQEDWSPALLRCKSLD